MDKEPLNTKRKWAFFAVPAILILIAVTSIIAHYRNSQTVVGSFFVNAQDNLLTTNGRTNVVLMGVGGEGHETPDLTDSIVFISINHASSRVAILPIPRDIWVKTMRAKVNSAYYYGNEKREDGGLDLAKSSVAEITGQPVHYVLVLDFKGFINAIDTVGGVDIDIERSFDDYLYPIPGKEDAEPEEDRYEHLRFEQGEQHMNGELALKFSRSRYAEGLEGTDFARSARQQKILNAFLDKIFSVDSLLHPTAVKETMDQLQSSINTDIVAGEYASFLKAVLSFRKEGRNLTTGNLEDYLETPVDRSLYDGQWVLAPVVDWQEIHDYVTELVEK